MNEMEMVEARMAAGRKKRRRQKRPIKAAGTSPSLGRGRAQNGDGNARKGERGGGLTGQKSVR
jgi:hypothetical protein